MLEHFGTEGPDLFVCDYLDKLLPSSTRKVSARWEGTADVSMEAKRFAQKHGLAFLSATQNNRAGNKNPNADITELSNLQTAKDADTLIMLTEDPDDPYVAPEGDEPGEPGTINARFVRGRTHGKQRVGTDPFRMSVEFSTGSIAEGSEFARSPQAQAFRRSKGDRSLPAYLQHDEEPEA
jgi:hypothetical protein